MAPWGVVQTREQAGDSIFEDIPERACWCTGVLFRGFAPPEKLLSSLGLDLGLGKRALVPSAALVDRASPKWEIQMLRILVLTARRRPVVPASPAREFPGDVADSALTQDDQAWRRLSSARSDGFPKPALIPFTSTSKEPEA